MATNFAAWINEARSERLEVGPAPVVEPRAEQILVKNFAVGINPIDGKLQETDFFHIQYPAIFGHEVAGEVFKIGPGVTRFKEGDRVIGRAMGQAVDCSSEMGFQTYTVLNTYLSCHIPEFMSFERAVALPVGMVTASAALFPDEFLGLQLPSNPSRQPNGKVLLVWGGASSVGSAAIQLSVSAGYEVVTTASAKNFDYVKKLGASYVFDYNSPTVVADLVEASKGKVLVGALDTIGGPAWAPTIEVVQQSEGPNIVVTLIPGFPQVAGLSVKQPLSRTTTKSHITKAVWEDFLPNALESGLVVPAPEPLIAGSGLESIQGAINLQRKGVSAQKVVVLL